MKVSIRLAQARAVFISIISPVLTAMFEGAPYLLLVPYALTFVIGRETGSCTDDEERLVKRRQAVVSVDTQLLEPGADRERLLKRRMELKQDLQRARTRFNGCEARREHARTHSDPVFYLALKVTAGSLLLCALWSTRRQTLSEIKFILRQPVWVPPQRPPRPRRAPKPLLAALPEPIEQLPATPRATLEVGVPNRRARPRSDAVWPGVLLDFAEHSMSKAAASRQRSLEAHSIARDPQMEFENPLLIVGMLTVLKIDPLNSSALNHLLAESGADRATNLEFQKRITEASERSLGPAVFKRHTGQFGEFFEGRLFVHQLCTLAAGLHEAGQLEECCEVFERVLRLDTGDMFNTRWSLIALYLERGLPAPASAILTRYAADGRHQARSLWLRVLERYLAGQHEDAIRALGDALGVNAYVANLLLFEDCESFARASKKQQTLLAAAEGIVQLIERCWQAHPRALLWLHATLHPQQVS